MSPRPDPPALAPAQELRLAWVLWFALLLGPLLFSGVAMFLVLEDRPAGILEDRPGAPVEIVRQVIGIGAYVPLGIALILSFVLRVSRVGAPAGDTPEERLAALLPRLLASFRTLMVLQWAVAESGGLLAAVAILMTGRFALAEGALAAWVVVMLLLTPTRGRFLRLVAAPLSEHGLRDDALERALSAH